MIRNELGHSKGEARAAEPMWTWSLATFNLSQPGVTASSVLSQEATGLLKNYLQHNYEDNATTDLKDIQKERSKTHFYTNKLRCDTRY